MHPAERPRREDEVAVRPRAEQRGADGEEPRAGVGLVAAEVERRANEHVPEAVDGFVGFAQSPEQVSEALVRFRLR